MLFRPVAEPERGTRPAAAVRCLRPAPGGDDHALCRDLMRVMYALEGRGRQYVLLFALGCVLSSLYGFLSGAWPFGVVELIWSVVAVRRYRELAPAG